MTLEIAARCIEVQVHYLKRLQIKYELLTHDDKAILRCNASYSNMQKHDVVISNGIVNTICIFI